MNKLKTFIGAILLFIAMFIISAIDNFSTGGVILGVFAAFLFGGGGCHLICKYGKYEELD